jgi:hypothetical protein
MGFEPTIYGFRDRRSAQTELMGHGGGWYHDTFMPGSRDVQAYHYPPALYFR